MKTLRNMQTKDRIAQAIREEILSGHMEPGEELAQEALAEMLGVSRMPVREALQTLVQGGGNLFAQQLFCHAGYLLTRKIRFLRSQKLHPPACRIPPAIPGTSDSSPGPGRGHAAFLC